MSSSHRKFLGDLSIAPRGLSRLLLASLKCTRDLVESVRVGVYVCGLWVTLRPHVSTECVSVYVWGRVTDIREQDPKASVSRLTLRFWLVLW